MIIIDIVTSIDAEGSELISPAQSFPADAIRIMCDGEKYTVHQAGDVPPSI